MGGVLSLAFISSLLAMNANVASATLSNLNGNEVDFPVRYTSVDTCSAEHTVSKLKDRLDYVIERCNLQLCKRTRSTYDIIKRHSMHFHSVNVSSAIKFATISHVTHVSIIVHTG